MMSRNYAELRSAVGIGIISHGNHRNSRGLANECYRSGGWDSLDSQRMEGVSFGESQQQCEQGRLCLVQEGRQGTG